MEALMFFAALAIAGVGQWLNSKPNVPPLVVKAALAAVGPMLYLLISQPTALYGPAFIEWLDKAWLWALALPGLASLLGLAPGMATRSNPSNGG